MVAGGDDAIAAVQVEQRSTASGPREVLEVGPRVKIERETAEGETESPRTATDPGHLGHRLGTQPMVEGDHLESAAVGAGGPDQHLHEHRAVETSRHGEDHPVARRPQPVAADGLQHAAGERANPIIDARPIARIGRGPDGPRASRIRSLVGRSGAVDPRQQIGHIEGGRHAIARVGAPPPACAAATTPVVDDDPGTTAQLEPLGHQHAAAVIGAIAGNAVDVQPVQALGTVVAHLSAAGGNAGAADDAPEAGVRADGIAALASGLLAGQRRPDQPLAIPVGVGFHPAPSGQLGQVASKRQIPVGLGPERLDLPATAHTRQARLQVTNAGGL